MAVPVAPLSNLLVDFLNQGENETICEQSLDYQPQPPGQYIHMLDGRVPRSVRDMN
ncbi:hypothetical protein OE88DRAFT_1669554 [Heliocybe sulcata]|uniref:Uncharacterized protein n=1 Tax=Heliocybe sulcata TaxID=5364 RepID=A0A5C3MJX1_9AGAM|nr:hypothetical protein OE88DRAFT_1669554 [Heliocybe sulcata]